MMCKDELIDSLTKAMLEWDKHEDRLSFRADMHLVSFKSRESARAFKALFPNWRVYFEVDRGFPQEEI